MITVKRRTIFFFLLPTLLTLALINCWPILYTLYTSTTNASLFKGDEYEFIGLQNYQTLFSNLQGSLFISLGLTLLYVAVCLLLFLLFGFATALALNNKQIKGLPFWRVILIIPWTVPSVITALIWKFLFHNEFGPIDQLLRMAFGSQAGIPWLTTPIGAFAAVVITNLWLSYPFFAVMILGALQSIPQELHEAARVDGSNAWQHFWHITFPLIRPALLAPTILSAITTFQMFNTVFLITAGGPIASADQPGATTFIMVYLYQQILGQGSVNTQYGMIATYSIVIFLFLVVLTTIAMRASRTSQEAAA